ncbi:hypothetical protein [Micromonospora globbae]|nr:TauD/TfdA family dioxygenase [Micromonospora globbae]
MMYVPNHLTNGLFIVSDGRERFLSSAYAWGKGWRYDPGCMSPCEQRARQTVKYFEEALKDAHRHEWSATQQLLVIDNRRTLHGRAAVEEGDEDRLLHRVAFYTGGREVTAADNDEEALWLKAKLFLNHAMDDDEPRTFDEQALWASLALELLAKAALARVSPLLVASPTEDGTNLLIASGLVEGEGRFTSVKAHTLYSRCHKAFRPFSEREAQQITWARNEYLHGGAASFTAIPPNAWWPRYWAQAVILVNAQDKTLEELVGPDRVPLVEKHLAQTRRI